MKKIFLALIILSILLLSVGAVYAVPPATCGAVTSSITLTGDLGPSTPCLSIGANNIVVNGAGFSVFGGIRNNGRDNITIKNFGLITGESKMSGMVNSTIFNNTMTAVVRPLFLDAGTSFNTVSFNTITASGGFGAAITLREKSNSNIISSNILTTTGSFMRTIFLRDSSTGNKLSSNIITAKGSRSSGIEAVIGAGGLTSTNDRINATGSEIVVKTGGNKFFNTILSGPGIVSGSEVNFSATVAKNIAVNVPLSPPEHTSTKKNLSRFLVIARAFGIASVTPSISYSDSDVVGIDESSIRMHRFPPAGYALLGGSVNTVTNTVTAPLFTRFNRAFFYAPLGDPSAQICGNGIVEVPEQCDDGDILNATSCGIGACQVNVADTCVNSGPANECTTVACVAGNPTSEICNNIDDDCDGTVDSFNQACYTGPIGTQGVGICVGGTETCTAGSFGACVGQVTPQTETCNGLDDDCNGFVDDIDADGDGVNDCTSDACLGSGTDNIIPLAPNNYAQNINFGAFEVGPQHKQSIVYSMATTNGCTCTQIVAALDAGKGHLKKGCSPSIMEEFTGVPANPDRALNVKGGNKGGRLTGGYAVDLPSAAQEWIQIAVLAVVAWLLFAISSLFKKKR